MKGKYCMTCSIVKPERCHHCSVCDRCVTMLDHHCPWVNNCIGFANKKQFIILLFYCVLVTLCGSIFMSLKVMEIVKEEEFNLLQVIFILATLGHASLLVTIFTFFMFHLKLLCSNLTTLENILKRKNEQVYLMDNLFTSQQEGENVYDIGKCNNIKQIFGKNSLLWLLPIRSNEDECENGNKFTKKDEITLIQYPQQQFHRLSSIQQSIYNQTLNGLSGSNRQNKIFQEYRGKRIKMSVSNS